MAVKRSFDVLNDKTNTYINDDIVKKQKISSSPSNFGLLSPPTTPENQKQKTIDLSNKSLNSISKNLHLKLQSTPELTTISPYTTAKNLFLRSSKPTSSGDTFSLSGRESEATLLHTHIIKSLETLQSTSIYVSGPPGTGKSAQINTTINYLISQANQSKSEPAKNIYTINTANNNKPCKIRIIKFNCMSISNPLELFKEIYLKISNGSKYNTNKGSSQLYDLFTKRSKSDCDMNILILDEMDNIVTKSQQSLFELFTWSSDLIESSSNKPNLLLIGIANALNLTDRFLPRLRANCISPKLIQFLPYTATQIKSVITNKLFSLVSLENKENVRLPPLVHPAAIQFCAKKSAVTTGDLRKAFDVMFKSLDMFEQQILETKSVDELLELPVDKLPKLMISQVVKVCSSSFNSNFDLKLKPLNLQKKMILAFLFKFEEKVETEQSQTSKKSKIRKFNNESISINSFFQYYLEKCNSFDKSVITKLKRGEFLEILTSLDIHGLVSISMVNTSSSTKSLVANKSVSLNFDNFKVTSSIPKMEFFKTVNDNIILKKIIYSNY